MEEELGLWRPISLADTFRKSVASPPARKLLLLWMTLTAACVLLGIFQVKSGWNGLAAHFGPLQFSVTIYPPLVICVWMVFWLGFEWAFISAYLATFWLAIYSGMGLQSALLFALVDPLALAVYALAYRTVRIPFDLRSLTSILWFLFVSFVAAVAGSAGSFIWSQEHGMPPVETFAIWQGWWVGALLQAILLDAPLLAIAAQRLETIKLRYFELPSRPEASLTWIVATITAGGLVLAGFLMVTGQMASTRMEHALATGISEESRIAISNAAYSWKLAVWTGMILTVAGSLGGVFLAYVWNHSLFREVKVRTAELQESEQRFRVTFDQAAVGIAHVAPDGRWLRVNQKLCDIVGYSRDELQRHTFQDITHPDDLDVDLEYVRRMLAGEIQTYSLQKRYLGKSGALIWIQLTVSLARSARGEARYFISIVEDITERKHLEEQLRQSQKMEAVGRLAGGVAHDFNNLLTVIAGYAQLMLTQGWEGDPHREKAEAICRAAERASALTSQLLAFSRKQIVQPKILDLGGVVTGMEGMLHRLLGENVVLSTRIDPTAGRVKADPGQIEQVIVNLAVNAKDAMPDGGRLAISVAPAEEDGELLVMIAVSDTGAGMDPEIQSYIFDPFFTTKPRGKGTGLGLSIVYGIVKQCGGSIRVRSEIKQGSTFEILLPRVEHAGTSLEEELTFTADVPFGTETVLLVEDEQILRKLAADVLRASGYEVVEAASGEDAVEIWTHSAPKFQLLVSDMIMPGMNGRALAERLRESAPALKVLYISGYTENILDMHGPLSGTTAFLQKPFLPAALTRKVRELLDA